MHTAPHIHRTLAAGVFAVALFAPVFASAAGLSFTPSSGTFPAGEEFTVKVIVDPEGENVNAAEGIVSFNPSEIAVTNISKDGSVFSLWTSEPSFSNGGGTVNFSGGTPSAFAAQGTVLSITFKGEKEGSATVSFSSGSVLAADGLGTDVYSGGGTATFTFGEAPPEPEPEPAPPPVRSAPPPISSGEKPLSPIITSPTHEQADIWYGTSTAIFTWKLSADIIDVAVAFAQEDDVEPDELLGPGATSHIVNDIEDGEWFLYAQFQNDVGWGEISRKKIRVDVTPPEEFEFEVVTSEDEDEKPKFRFKTKDALSGIDKYEVLIAERLAVTVRTKDFLEGDLIPIPPQDGGPQLVTIKAYDGAGNVRIVEETIELPLVEKPKPKGEEEEAPPVWTQERIALIIFAMIIGGLGTMNYYTGKNAEAERRKILREVLDIREKNDRIFSAMREEFEQMVHDLDEKPQLTPTERNLLENIKEVLEISEGLVDSGIEDLKQTVRGK